MNLAEELAKLEALLKSGALTEEEFAQAKARLLNPTPAPAPVPATAPSGESRVGQVFGCLFGLAILGVVAYFAVPWGIRQWKEFNEKTKEATDAQERAALLMGAGKQRLEAELDGGIWTHDVVITNVSDDILHETTLKVLIVKNKGKETELKQFWDRWVPGEKKRVNFSASDTRTGVGVIVDGFAFVKKDGDSKKVPLAASWSWTPK